MNAVTWPDLQRSLREGSKPPGIIHRCDSLGYTPQRGGGGFRGSPIVAKVLDSDYELVKTVLDDGSTHGGCVQEPGIAAL